MKITAVLTLAGVLLAVQAPSTPVEPTIVPAGYLLEGRYAAEPIHRLVARPPAYDAVALAPRS
jgi:hypothetical protein